MSFTSVFNNFGHAIASTVKAFVGFANDAQKVLANVEADAVSVASMLNLINPKAGKYADTAYHILGDVATAIEKAGIAASAEGLNVPMDLATFEAIKAIIVDVKAMIGAAKMPSATAPPVVVTH
jgi:ABC-type transporter Mla subunit MlaD